MRKYVCVCGRSKIHVKMGKIRGHKRAEKESGIGGKLHKGWKETDNKSGYRL